MREQRDCFESLSYLALILCIIFTVNEIENEKQGRNDRKQIQLSVACAGARESNP